MQIVAGLQLADDTSDDATAVDVGGCWEEEVNKNDEQDDDIVVSFFTEVKGKVKVEK